tara:strand:- start:5582 stop:5971 length:390 start_codon:yes stop_codon:yes gene_type:complete
MKKRTAVCGVPVYVVRRQMLPLIVINGVLALFFVLMPGVVLDFITDKTIENRMHGMLFLVSIAFLPLISSAWVFVRMSRYMKRMKRLKGRACFVCNYEIAEGLDRCSECGAGWSLDDLNRYWRRNVGGE